MKPTTINTLHNWLLTNYDMLEGETAAAMANDMMRDGELPARKIRRYIAVQTGEPFRGIPYYCGSRDLNALPTEGV